MVRILPSPSRSREDHRRADHHCHYQPALLWLSVALCCVHIQVMTIGVVYWPEIDGFAVYYPGNYRIFSIAGNQIAGKPTLRIPIL